MACDLCRELFLEIGIWTPGELGKALFVVR
jgi:hypothetical protein